MRKYIVIRSNSIVTCRENGGDEIIDGYILVEGDKIKDIVTGEVPIDINEVADYIDAKAMTVTPGLIDSHTHLVHGGSRRKTS